MKKIIMLLVFSLLLIVTACSNKTTTTSNITTTGSKNSFEIINPKSNATDVDINLIIEWTKNDNATSYTVLLYEQPSNIVVFSETVNTLSIEVSDLRPNKEYKVLIKAKGNNYEESISSYFTTKNVLASVIDDFNYDNIEEQWYLENAEEDVNISLDYNNLNVKSLNIKADKSYRADRSFSVSKDIVGALSNWTGGKSLKLNLQSDESFNNITITLLDSDYNMAYVIFSVQNNKINDLYIQFSDFIDIENLNLEAISKLSINVQGKGACNLYVNSIEISDEQKTTMKDFEASDLIRETYDDYSSYTSTLELRKVWTEGEPTLVSEYGENIMLISKGTSKTTSQKYINLSKYNSIRVTYWTIESYNLGLYMWIDGIDNYPDGFYKQIVLQASSSQDYSTFTLRIPSSSTARLGNLQFKDVMIDTKISKIEFLCDNSAPELSYKTTKSSITINPIDGCEYSIDGGSNWSDENVFEGLETSVPYIVSIRYKATQQFEASEMARQEVILSDICFDEVFMDNMVLQRNMINKITGSAEPNTQYSLSYNGQVVTCVTDEDGRFSFELQPMQALLMGQKLTIYNEYCSISLVNVVVGEVWIVAGQSNNQIKLAALTDDYTNELALSNSGNIRLFKQAMTKSDVELDTFTNGYWTVANRLESLDFSAVGYLYGAQLYEALNKKVPVGIVYAAEGSTNIQNWISQDGYTPIESELSYAHKNYNSMVSPLTPLTVKGVIWYQGENNCTRFKEYPELLEKLVIDWRNKFENPNLYFQVIQLPIYDSEYANWAYIREAQEKGCELIDDCDLIVTIDDGDPVDIHPTRKKYFVERCVAMAMYKLYGGSKVEFPVASKFTPEGNKLIVTVENATSLNCSTDEILGFEIAGSDYDFYPATAQISGNQIILTSKDVLNPLYVRYNFTSLAGGKVYDQNNWPLIPFRSDNSSTMVIDDFSIYRNTTALNARWSAYNATCELQEEDGNQYMAIKDNSSGQVSIAYTVDVKSYDGIFIKFKLADGATSFTLTVNSNGGYPYKTIQSTAKGWQTVMISFDELNGYKGYNFSYIIIKPEAGKSVYIDKVSLVSLK